MYRDAVFHGKTSRICCATHAVVGCAVTPKCSMRRRSVARHDEDERNGEGGRWQHKEIGRDEAADVVVEERPPRLRRWLPMPHHVPRYSRLRCVDSQLHEFAVDARSAPKMGSPDTFDGSVRGYLWAPVVVLVCRAWMSRSRTHESPSGCPSQKLNLGADHADLVPSRARGRADSMAGKRAVSEQNCLSAESTSRSVPG